MTDRSELFEDEDLVEAHGIVLDFMKVVSEDTPDWDEIAVERSGIRVFVTDRTVELPPKCAGVISELLANAGLQAIPVTYEHAHPIELQ